MENANKAILMAGGMLFAIMIMSLVAFVFTELKVLPNQEDSKILTEQAAAFNNEYTAYDKKIMYGVDVISVLNKAYSNNEKYVKERFVAGGGYNTDFIIDIEVELKTTLEESMTISFVQQTTTGVAERDYTTGDGPKDATGSYLKAGDGNKRFKIPSSEYQQTIYGNGNYWGSLKFVTNTITTDVAPGVYHLLGGEGADPDPINDSVDEKNEQLNADNKLKQLLSQSTEMSQTIKNRGEDIFGETGWSQAVWKPAVYDLKTRKFRCTGSTISEKTGRIVQMKFKEI